MLFRILLSSERNDVVKVWSLFRVPARFIRCLIPGRFLNSNVTSDPLPQRRMKASFPNWVRVPFPGFLSEKRAAGIRWHFSTQNYLSECSKIQGDEWIVEYPIQKFQRGGKKRRRRRGRRTSGPKRNLKSDLLLRNESEGLTDGISLFLLSVWKTHIHRMTGEECHRVHYVWTPMWNWNHSFPCFA